MGSKTAPDDNCVVGLIPAAGRATRLGKLPCSKEILPVGFTQSPVDAQTRVRPACHDLLAAMRIASVRHAYMAIGHGKWDIPAYLGDGSDRGPILSYVVVRDSPSVTHTVDRAYPFLRGATVVFGFPDIVFQPTDVLARLRTRLDRSPAAVVLGLFPAQQHHKVDMVAVDQGRVRRIDIKPRQTPLELTWILAAWTPAFTEFLHDWVATTKPHSRDPDQEAHLGCVLQTAIDDGWHIDSVVVADGWYQDIGTFEELSAATRHLT